MGKNAHTPGPWIVGDDPEPGEEGDYPSESVWYDGNGSGAEIAGRICEPGNAILIAAAPDLLEAARTALIALRHGNGSREARAAYDGLFAAIAKAEGSGGAA